MPRRVLDPDEIREIAHYALEMHSGPGSRGAKTGARLAQKLGISKRTLYTRACDIRHNRKLGASWRAVIDGMQSRL